MIISQTWDTRYIGHHTVSIGQYMSIFYVIKVGRYVKADELWIIIRCAMFAMMVLNCRKSLQKGKYVWLRATCAAQVCHLHKIIMRTL